MKIEEKEKQPFAPPSKPLMVDEINILILAKKADELGLLETLSQGIGLRLQARSAEEAALVTRHMRLAVLVVDQSLADYPLLKEFIAPGTSVLVVGKEEKTVRDLIHGWPPDFFIDFVPFPDNDEDRQRYGRALKKAAEHARLKLELEKLKPSREISQARFKEVYSEIEEIKSFISDNVIKELEKRIALQVRYLWFQRRKQKIEDILRKIYVADDVSSLLDTVSDIKELVQASGITFYILDENETLGKYLKPLVWDDAFLSHTEFAKYLALLNTQDFAAQVVSQKEIVNLANVAPDRRVAKRYLEHLKQPLRHILSVPIRHEKAIIGVLEVYNKLHKGELSKIGFNAEDEQVLQGLSEHIALAMTKLNLIQYDALTGLLRPDPFFEKVIQKVSLQSKRRQETGSYAMVMGDVDWFKHYNDRNGHEAGNRLLRKLAAVLKSSIREDDLICRYGGEEFLFFLTGVNSLEEACFLTERIRKRVEEQYFENEEFQPRSNLTMSFGVTLLPRKEEFYTVINRYELKKVAIEADMALAEAKGKRFTAAGSRPEEEKDQVKNKVCVYQRDTPDREKKVAVIKPYRDKLYVEKRREERHYVSTLILYCENGQFKLTRTVNLSLGGVRIFTDTKLLLHKTVDLLLVLENRATPLKGEIVYSERANEESPHFFTGLEFREILLPERKLLENYLTSLPRREVSG